MPAPNKHDTRACRITKVTAFVVGMRWRNCVFAQVETDEGISGIGEGSLNRALMVKGCPICPQTATPDARVRSLESGWATSTSATAGPRRRRFALRA